MKVLNRVMKHTFYLDNLLITQKYVSLHCVFHSIRFKVNKGWSKALLLFLCPVPRLSVQSGLYFASLSSYRQACTSSGLPVCFPSSSDSLMHSLHS